MVDHGNHESGYSFAHFTEFFRSQPSNTPWVTTDNGEAPNNWFFSWNMGLVHFVTISSGAHASAQPPTHTPMAPILNLVSRQKFPSTFRTSSLHSGTGSTQT